MGDHLALDASLGRDSSQWWSYGFSHASWLYQTFCSRTRGLVPDKDLVLTTDEATWHCMVLSLCPRQATR
nr:hypothetical protein [Tanacetum cinerariifolium]